MASPSEPRSKVLGSPFPPATAGLAYKPISKTKSQPTSADPTTQRLTENKRRYRARRKEYISDLEKRLAEAREQGVRATQEVQLAARNVVQKNERLRELLRLAGFSDDEINVWVERGACREGGDGAGHCGLYLNVERKARACSMLFGAGGTGVVSSQVECERRPSGETRQPEGELGESAVLAGIDLQRVTGTPYRATEPPRPYESDTPGLPSAEAPAAAHAPTADPQLPPTESSTCRGKPIPRCKLLTRLAQDPSADLTQVPEAAGSNEPSGDTTGHGDIPCGKAYEMLIRYATSEEKMDHIATALENGCTMKGNGSCAVKSKVVLEALDRVCG